MIVPHKITSIPLDTGYQFLLDMESRHVFTMTVPAKWDNPRRATWRAKEIQKRRRSVPFERKGKSNANSHPQIFFFPIHSNHQADDRVLEKGSGWFERRDRESEVMMAKARLALRGFRRLAGLGETRQFKPQSSPDARLLVMIKL